MRKNGWRRVCGQDSVEIVVYIVYNMRRLFF